MTRKRTTDRDPARVQAIDAQIRRAEQYGQMGQLEALKEQRERVVGA
ncbi:MAG: hypothetical protein ABJN69_06850 [Hellea sp.]